MVLLSTDLFLESMDSTYDFYAGEGLEIFSVKSSPSAHKIWNDIFVKNVPALVNKILRPKESKSFACIMTTLLKEQGFRVKSLNEKRFGMRIGDLDFNRSSEISKTKNQVVYWSKDLGIYVIQKQLQESSLWIIDEDSSCAAVVCHRS
ncbi:hypothetical protein SLA2020_158430 [Shorea laevis]